jgi:hypothetical protein
MSATDIWIMVIVIVLSLATWLLLVARAARRPYYKHPVPPPMPTGVRGGVHLGDPRSVAPPVEETITPVTPENEQEPAERDAASEEERHKSGNPMAL